MASLNQIADYIAGSLKQPLNDELKRRIKFSVKFWRAELIKQDTERNGSSGIYLQRFTVDLIKVDKVDSCKVTSDCKVLRTLNKVPKPIRRTDDVDFKFVGVADGKKSFTEADFEDLDLFLHLKYTSKSIRYKYVNGYIYVFNANKMKYLGLEYSLENPQEAVDLCSSSNSSDCYNDDMEFPLPVDMIRIIIKGMLDGEYQIFNDNDLTVRVEPNAESFRPRTSNRQQ